MADHTDKATSNRCFNGSDSDEMSCKTPERLTSDGSNVKTCVDCGTSKTPLWRGGPAGPKTLCNACGIRSRKKRRALMGVTKEDKKTKKSPSMNGKPSLIRQQSNTSESSTSSSGDCTQTKIGGFGLKNKLWAFGKDLGLQRPRSNTNQRRKIGEVEQAAFLLMALSCGSVYA